jgi:integrase
MGTGRVWKRGHTWWIQYNVAGRQYRESARTTRKENAEALLSKRQQAIWEGEFFPGARRRRDLTLAGLRDLWLETKRSKRSLSHDKTRLAAAVAHFGEHRPILTLTADDIAGYQSALEHRVSAATVNRHLAVLRSALNLATVRGHAHQDPMRTISLADERSGRNRHCSRDEYTRLRDAATGDTRLLIIIAYWTGMRLGEIVGLDRSRFVGGMMRLVARDTKEAAAKSVPIPAEARAEIESMPHRINGKIFGNNTDTYSRRFSRLCCDLGINGLHFHDLRHTAVTNMRRAGVDLVTIAQITGHRTLTMLRRYNVVTVDDLSEAMARVEDHAAGLDRSKR